jgi:hypothetical protein
MMTPSKTFSSDRQNRPSDEFGATNILTPYFFKIRLNIILPSIFRSPKSQIFRLYFARIAHLPHVHLIRLRLDGLITSGEEHNAVSYIQFRSLFSQLITKHGKNEIYKTDILFIF